MKSLLLAIAVVVVPLRFIGAEVPADIRLSNGIVLRHATISKVEPDGIKFLHDGGVVKVRYEDLPQGLKESYHFDPAKASEFRNNKGKEQLAFEEERKRKAAAMREEENARGALLAQQENEKRKRMESTSSAGASSRIGLPLRVQGMAAYGSVRFEVLEISDNGMLCRNAGPLPVPREEDYAVQAAPQRALTPAEAQARDRFLRASPYNATFEAYDPDAARRAEEAGRRLGQAEVAQKLDARERSKAGYPFGTFIVRGNYSKKYSEGKSLIANLYFCGDFTVSTVAGPRTLGSYANTPEAAIEFAKAGAKPLPGNPNEGEGRKDSAVAGGSASGTAFAISRDGHLVTNRHVVKGAKTIEVLIEGKRVLAQLVRIDAANDLAVIKIEQPTTPLALAEKEYPRLGQEVLTVGFPNPEIQGKNIKLTKGVISSLSGLQDDVRLLQIDASVQPGNSGGPLTNLKGQVLGVVAARLDDATAIASTGALPQNINYAIKVDYLRALLTSIPGLSDKLASPNNDASSVEESAEKLSKSTFLVLVGF